MMILSTRSSLKTFRSSEFQNGFNVVLADTKEDSKETESTNGLGKTTLLRVLHFCLGASLQRDKVLSHPELSGVVFGISLNDGDATLDIDRRIGEDTVLISRWLVEASEIEIIETVGSQARITLNAWLYILSLRFVPDAQDKRNNSFAPTFREISLYLIRLGKPAFTDPVLAFQGQSGPSKRQSVSYLLGLNWSQQRKLQEERQRREQITSTLKAFNDADKSVEDGTIGDMEAERVVLEGELKKKHQDVISFNVREDYKELEERLNFLDRKIHDSLNENHSDTRLLEYYQKGSGSLIESDPDQPIAILKGAGAVFREDTLRTLSEVAAFHKQIYKNRHDFLKGEIERLVAVIRRRSASIDELVADKEQLLRVLSNSGAIEALIELQKGMRDTEAKLNALRAKIEDRKRFDRRKDEISQIIIQTRTLLKRDLEDRRPIVDDAVALFAKYTAFLYGRPGRFAIDVKDAGYAFSFAIDREGSDGVDQMVVFCFDLTIASLRARRKEKFLTLIHDSSMFADVDPRQYGLALQLAHKVSQAEGFQYICCLNSGALPISHLGELNLDNYVRLRLNDDGHEGRLLGIKLSPREK